MLYQQFIKNNTEAFIAKVIHICELLRINPDWLMVVMYAESRINHQAVNIGDSQRFQCRNHFDAGCSL